MAEPAITPPGLRWYATFLAAATFFLVIAGGMVTSTGSALAVPDWPLSFGQWFPPMEGGVFYEHGHRMIAATIGFLTIVLAVWIFKSNVNAFLKKAGWIALALVCAQGLLGGVTVLLKLPAVTSVSHACLGQIFFSWMCCVAASTWVIPSAFRYPAAAKLSRLSVMTTIFVFLQVLAGAIYRHTGTMLHAHFLGAFLVTVHVVLSGRRVYRDLPDDIWLTRFSTVLMALVGLQLVLGWYTWQRPNISIATIHQSMGALIFGASAVQTFLTFYRVSA